MKSYWDLSDKERANLTEEEIKNFFPYELMAAGVVPPKEPILKEIKQLDIVPEKQFYKVQFNYRIILFDNMDDARKFAEMNSYDEDSDYKTGDKFKFATLHQNKTINVSNIYSIEQIEKYRTQLEYNKEAKESNEKALEAYKKESQAAENAVTGIWRDYFKIQNEVQRAKHILETYTSYIRIADNENVAFKFLEKAFSKEEIEFVDKYLDTNFYGPQEETPSEINF